MDGDIVAATDGRVTLTLRDSTGTALADYIEVSDGTHLPALSAHYVHLGDQLAAIHKDCGPAPELRVVSVDDQVLTLEKLDHIPPLVGYRIAVESNSGVLTEILEPPSLPDQFTVDLALLPATERSWIRLETQAAAAGPATATPCRSARRRRGIFSGSAGPE